MNNSEFLTKREAHKLCRINEEKTKKKNKQIELNSYGAA